MEGFSYCVALLPSHQHGLAKLVERFQVDSTASTHSEYEGRPYLRDVLCADGGWIDSYPDYIDTPLFFVTSPPGMAKKSVDALIKKGIADDLKSLVEVPALQVKFNGVLKEAKEAQHAVWRILSHQQDQVQQLCARASEVFVSRGFSVNNAPANTGELYITIRGRWPNDTTEQARPARDDLDIVFDKLGVTHRPCERAGRECNARRQSCGSTVSLNFGPLSQVIDSIANSRMIVRYAAGGTLSANQARRARQRQHRQEQRERQGALTSLPEEGELLPEGNFHRTSIVEDSEFAVAQTNLASIDQNVISALQDRNVGTFAGPASANVGTMTGPTGEGQEQHSEHSSDALSSLGSSQALNSIGPDDSASQVVSRWLIAEDSFPMPVLPQDSSSNVGESMISSQSLNTDSSDLSVLSTQGPRCFLKGTILRCSNGRYQSVEEFSQGDVVVSANGIEITIQSVVEHPEEPQDCVLLCVGNVVNTFTGSHRVSICRAKQRQAVRAETLRLGDDVFLSDDSTARLTTLRTFQQTISVFEFAFEPDLPIESFAVPTSILSHGRRPRRSNRNVHQGSELNASIPEIDSDWATDSEWGFPQRRCKRWQRLQDN
jgi:hypothetical protein